MGKHAVLLATCLLAFVGPSLAWSPQCKLGVARCIKSQGTEIPSDKAVTMLDDCGHFIEADRGATVMRLSDKEILDRAQGRVTPLVRAWDSFHRLHDSPLKFDRSGSPDKGTYTQMKRACIQLERDFNDDSKWTK